MVFYIFEVDNGLIIKIFKIKIKLKLKKRFTYTQEKIYQLAKLNELFALQQSKRAFE
jgi:hypothetical protein